MLYDLRYMRICGLGTSASSCDYHFEIVHYLRGFVSFEPSAGTLESSVLFSYFNLCDELSRCPPVRQVVLLVRC